MCLLKSYIDDKNQKNHAGIIPEGGKYEIVDISDGSITELKAGENFPELRQAPYYDYGDLGKNYSNPGWGHHYKYGDYEYSYHVIHDVDYGEHYDSIPKHTYTPLWRIRSAPLTLQEMPLASINGVPVSLDSELMRDRLANNPDIADEILSNHENLSVPNGINENGNRDEHDDR